MSLSTSNRVSPATSQHLTNHYLNARWLVKLRWVAVIGQLATIAGAVFLIRIQIPMAWAMAIVILLTAASNLFLTVWFRRWKQIDDRLAGSASHPVSPLPWNLILGLVLVMDLLSLTTLLFTSGGPNNPFSLFFFVNLSLCALMLNRRWAWAINLLTIGCFAALMFEHYELDKLGNRLETIRSLQNVSLQHTGLLVAFATCASVIVYFMTRLADELAIQQQKVRRAQALQASSDKVEALGTLAAGTAHELATPLSTIAIVARDVEKAFEQHPPDFPGAEDIVEDVHLIRSQLDRCRKILDTMASHAGEAIGEQVRPVTVEAISKAMIDGLIGGQRVTLNLPDTAKTEILNVPLAGLSQAMRGLVQNAIDSDSDEGPVTIDIFPQPNRWSWRIQDQGRGMSASQLERVSEPFYTTKPPGKGMGLGVFLAMNVVRRLGGSVEFESKVGKGTCVTVSLGK